MSIQNGTSLTKEALEYLVGLVRDISGLDSKLIDDINLKTNGTYSSVRIKSLIDKNLEEANKHTEDLISTLNKLSSKKTNVQPTLNNSEFNVIYLYSATNTAPFEQYLKIGTNDSDAELISLGSTNISLDEYLTVLEASKTYAKQVDLDTTNNTLTTHINNSDIHVSTTDREKWNEVDNKVDKTDFDTLKTKIDNKVDKTDIVSVLDSTVTNKQLVDGKTLVDKFNSIEDNFSRRYNFDNIRHKRTIDRRLAIKAVIDTFKKDGASITSIDYYEKNSVFIIRYNQGYYYTYIMTSYFNKVFILEYSVYSTDMILWVEDETGELYIRGTIPITEDVIRFVNPFTTNKDKYKLYDGKYTIDENTKTCTLTVSIDCLSPASTSTNFGTLNELNFKTPSSPRTFDLKAEDDSTSIMRFYLGEMYCQMWGGTAGKRYTGTVTYTTK